MEKGILKLALPSELVELHRYGFKLSQLAASKSKSRHYAHLWLKGPLKCEKILVSWWNGYHCTSMQMYFVCMHCKDDCVLFKTLTILYDHCIHYPFIGPFWMVKFIPLFELFVLQTWLHDLWCFSYILGTYYSYVIGNMVCCQCSCSQRLFHVNFFI